MPFQTASSILDKILAPENVLCAPSARSGASSMSSSSSRSSRDTSLPSTSICNNSIEKRPDRLSTVGHPPSASVAQTNSASEPMVVSDPLPSDEVCLDYNRASRPYGKSCIRLHVFVDKHRLRDSEAKLVCKDFLRGKCTCTQCRRQHPSRLHGTRPPLLREIQATTNADFGHVFSDGGRYPKDQDKPTCVKIPKNADYRRQIAVIYPKRRAVQRSSKRARAIFNLVSVVESPETCPPFSICPNYEPLPSAGDVKKVTVKLPEASLTTVSLPAPVVLLQCYCGDWQRGTCGRQNCKYISKPPKALPTNAEPSCSTPAASCTSSAVPRPTTTTLGQVSGTVVLDCTFCLLGLCDGSRHRTVSEMQVRNDINHAAPNQHPPHTNMSLASQPPPRPRLTTESIPLATARQENSANDGNVSLGHVALPSRTPSSSISEASELTTTLLKSTQVTFGPGLQVLDITTGFESSYVLLGNLPASITEDEIHCLAEPFGELVKVVRVTEKEHPGSRRSCLAKVQFSSPAQATSAVQALNGSEHFFDKITARLDYFKGKSRDVGRFSAALVRLDMPAPGLTAFAGYDDAREAEKVIKAVHGSTMMGQIVAAHLYNGVPKLGASTVRFEGLPFRTTETQLRALGGGKAEDIMMERIMYKSFMTASHVLEGIIRNSADIITINPPSFPPENGRIKCTVQFSTPADAASACSALNGSKFAFLGSERIYLDHLHSLTYSISQSRYSVLTREIWQLQGFAKSLPGVKLLISSLGSGETKIELLGTHMNSLKKAKTPLERMLAGERLIEDGKPAWDDFFSTPPGNAFIDNVMKASNTYITADHDRCNITIWGSPRAQRCAKDYILTETARLNSKKHFALPLSGRLLSRVLNQGLSILQEQLSVDSVTIDFRTRSLVVRGTEAEFNSAKDTLCNVSKSVDIPSRRSKASRVTRQHTCPICLDTVVNGVSLGCSHKSCKQCVVRYLHAASEHRCFPLKCFGDDGACQELLPIRLCKQVVENEQFSRLIDASFTSYIHSRPREFFYCPTADCEQIYRAQPGIILQCPSCLICICPTCHGEQHDGEECAASIKERERLFRGWKETHNVKSCPSCKADIEKVAGCNHITCTRCATHICWSCMDTFISSREVYDHMSSIHKGIGL